ncbi:probable G-protein coupled receptor 139 [Stegostoma tigrinum]|uniref:probable G-protein coupled receptor 139 n=1 Tax=Stegostoma tigrinum TaxID=3053191 RepID=UPI00202B6C31|nr:probable G-protein coupled receptor 139 [Stegostoma tigrinum]
MHGPAKGLFYAISYLIIAVVGVPANLVAILILSRGRCGLPRCITYYLMAIAVTDFLVIITGCILNRISRIYFSNSVLSTTPVCRLTTILVRCSRDGSVWITAAFTIDRFVFICSQSLRIRYCTEKTALLVIGAIFLLSCVKNFPLYTIYKPFYILDGVAWFCGIKSIFYTLPVWQAYEWMEHILTPFLPFLIILILNVLTVRQIVETRKVRRKLIGAENDTDPEMANRKRSIVLLFTISLSFLLLWAIDVGHFLYEKIKSDAYFNKLNFNDLTYIFQETTNMFQLLSSCNNVFIYAVSQNRFREDLKNVLFSPFAKLADCFKMQSTRKASASCSTSIDVTHHGALSFSIQRVVSCNS